MLASHTPKQIHLLAALAADCELGRPNLEARVCERYAVVKRESDRFLSGEIAIADPLL